MNSGYKNASNKGKMWLSSFMFYILIAQLFIALILDILDLVGLSIQITALMYVGITVLGTAFKIKYSDEPILSGRKTDMRYIWYIVWAVILGVAYYFDPTASTASLLGMAVPTRFAFLCTLSVIILFSLRFTGGQYRGYTSKMMPLMIIGLIVNFVFMVRAVSVYGDAVRSTNTAEAMGLGNYLFGLPAYAIVYGLSILTPIAFMFVFITKGDLYRKYAMIIAIIAFVSVIISQLATAAIGMLIALILMFVLKQDRRIKWLLFMLLGVLAVILVYTDGIAGILLWINNFIPEDVAWHGKLAEMAESFRNSDVTITQGREVLYLESWHTFLKSPLFGAGFTGASYYYGGHSTFLDMLATVGIFGTVPFIMFSVECYKHCVRQLKTREAVIAVQCGYFIFALFFFMKNLISSYAIFIAVFIILPILALRIDDYAVNKYTEEKGYIEKR